MAGITSCEKNSEDHMNFIAYLGKEKLTKQAFVSILKQLNPDYFLPYGKMEKKINTDKHVLRQLLEEYLLDEVIYHHAKQLNIESLPQFKEYVEEKLPEFNRYAHELLLIDANLRNNLSVSEKYLQPYATQYRVRHLLLHFPNREANRTLIQNIANTIDSPEDFIEMQSYYPQRSRIFGMEQMVGWVHKDQFYPWLTRIWFKLEDGAISQPIELDNGWYLFLREDSETMGPFTRIKMRYIYVPFFDTSILERDFGLARTQEETLKLAEELYAILQDEPEKMAALAIEHSEDSINANYGGGLNSAGKTCMRTEDLNWIYPKTLFLQVPGVKNQFPTDNPESNQDGFSLESILGLDSLGIHNISEPILTPRGYQIIRIEDVKRTSLQSIRGQRKIMGIIYEDAFQEAVVQAKRALVQEYLSDATIEEDAMVSDFFDTNNNTDDDKLEKASYDPFLIMADGKTYSMLDLPPSSYSYEKRMMRFISEKIIDYGLEQKALAQSIEQDPQYQSLYQVFLRARMVEFMRSWQHQQVLELFPDPSEDDVMVYWEKHKKLYEGNKKADITDPAFFDRIEKRLLSDIADTKIQIWNLELLQKYYYKVNTYFFENPTLH